MTSHALARVRGQQHVIRLGSIFSPLSFVFFLYVPLLTLYVVSSPMVFATEFDSRKALSWQAFAYFSVALIAFAIGAKLARDRAFARRPDRDGRDRELSAEQRRAMAVLVEAALLLSVAAYVLWFGLGIARAGGVGPFIDVWQRDPFRFKDEILATIPGVTTITQLSVAAIPLAVVFGLNRRGSVIRMLIALVIALAAARAVLNNERLALIELLLPLAFLSLAPRRITVSRLVVYVVALLALATAFFTVTELRRTYVYTGDFSAGRATTRFVGYYLTSVNNGMAVADEYRGATPAYATGEALWQFPVVAGLRLDHLPGVGTISLRYEDAFGVDPESFWPGAFQAQGLDYEFNVLTTPGYLAADFGWAGLLGMLVLGLLSGRLYRGSQTSLFLRAIYAVWVVGLFELMRIFYFGETRVLPAYLLFLAAYLVLRRRGVAQARGGRPVTTSAAAG